MSAETELLTCAPAETISVIVPTLDEEKLLPARLRELVGTPGLHEVVVVDGGSGDRTVEIARSFPGVSVLEVRRGRASQMNAGAYAASGSILVFLHVDTALPLGAASLIRATLADLEVVAGAFRTWTVCDLERSWIVPLLHLADLRSRYSSLPYGDQALFLRAEVFRRLGGFPDLSLMEDLEFSRRLRLLGRIRTVPACVRVSGRRFLSRPLYYALLMNTMPLLYRWGLPPAILAAWYRNPR